MELIFMVGNEKDRLYQRSGIAYVTDDDAFAIMNPITKESEVIYDTFCETIVPKAINNLPRNWYFIKSPTEYYCPVFKRN